MVEEDVLRVILGYIYTRNVELGLLDVKLFFQILENARMMCLKDLENSVRNHIMKIVQTGDIETDIEIFSEAVETKFPDILSNSLYFLPRPRYLYCHQAVSLLSVDALVVILECSDMKDLAVKTFSLWLNLKQCQDMDEQKKFLDKLQHLLLQSDLLMSLSMSSLLSLHVMVGDRVRLEVSKVVLMKSTLDKHRNLELPRENCELEKENLNLRSKLSQISARNKVKDRRIAALNKIIGNN